MESRTESPGIDTTLAAPPAPGDGAAHPIPDHEIERLRSRGLQDPIHQIVEDLRSHAEVIPHSGVMGGTPGFHDPNAIHVLSSRWVYARFDDGHFEGSGVFEYTIQPDGHLSWNVVSSSLEQ